MSLPHLQHFVPVSSGYISVQTHNNGVVGGTLKQFRQYFTARQ